MRTVTLYTENEALFRRVELILRGYAEVVRGTPGEATPHFAIIDRETVKDKNIVGTELPSTPIPHGWLIAAVKDSSLSDKPKICYSSASREVTIGDATVTLTEVEFRLFSALVSREGFISREELSQTVWGEHESGLLNVYVHYLREKLEKNGERIIISSRREGYKIDEKFERRELC